jgi:hypothetical protein
VGAGVHHHDTVAGAEKEFGVPHDPDAVVRDAVKEQNRTAIGMGRPNSPAAKHNAVGSTDLEVFAMGTGHSKRGVRFANEVWSKLPSDGMEEARANQPARNAGENRRENKENYGNSDKASAHWPSVKDTKSGLTGFRESRRGVSHLSPASGAPLPRFLVSVDSKGL